MMDTDQCTVIRNAVAATEFGYALDVVRLSAGTRNRTQRNCLKAVRVDVSRRPIAGLGQDEEPGLACHVREFYLSRAIEAQDSRIRARR